MRSYGWAAGLLLLLFGSTSLQAQVTEQAPDAPHTTPPSDPSPTAQPNDSSSSEASSAQADTDEKKWKFATIGYAWFAGATGETDVIGPVEPVDLDLSFGDVLKSFKFASMGAAEARRDRFIMATSPSFISTEMKELASAIRTSSRPSSIPGPRKSRCSAAIA